VDLRLRVPLHAHLPQRRRPDPALDNSRRLPSQARLTIDGDKFYKVWGLNVDGSVATGRMFSTSSTFLASNEHRPTVLPPHLVELVPVDRQARLGRQAARVVERRIGPPVVAEGGLKGNPEP